MFELTFSNFSFLSCIIFIIGVAGIVIRKNNLIAMLLSIELIIIALILQLVSYSAFMGDTRGQVFALLLLVAAAAKTIIGLSFVILYYRKKKTVLFDDISVMRG